MRYRGLPYPVAFEKERTDRGHGKIEANDPDLTRLCIAASETTLPCVAVHAPVISG